VSFEVRRLSQEGQRPVFDKKDDKEPKPFGKDKGRFGAVRPGVRARPATGVRAGQCDPPADPRAEPPCQAAQGTGMGRISMDASKDARAMFADLRAKEEFRREAAENVTAEQITEEIKPQRLKSAEMVRPAPLAPCRGSPAPRRAPRLTPRRAARRCTLRRA